jgi:hypothetical protein
MTEMPSGLVHAEIILPKQPSLERARDRFYSPGCADYYGRFVPKSAQFGSTSLITAASA